MNISACAGRSSKNKVWWREGLGGGLREEKQEWGTGSKIVWLVLGQIVVEAGEGIEALLIETSNKIVYVPFHSI